VDCAVGVQIRTVIKIFQPLAGFIIALHVTLVLLTTLQQTEIL
jgi:hypothetical protein